MYNILSYLGALDIGEKNIKQMTALISFRDL